MPKFRFNTTEPRVGRGIENPPDDEIRNTPGLFQASLDDALKYGGELTRAALSAFDLHGDREYVVVDTKIHMLKPGFMPAIPGWHTDAVPRATHSASPVGPLPPDLARQIDLQSPRMHLLTTGTGCHTLFAVDPIELDLEANGTTDLYAEVTRKMEAEYGGAFQEYPCRAVEWDWWQLHTAQCARASEWRFLIRVTETDYCAPNSDLRDVLRTQQQVYVPTEFGW